MANRPEATKAYKAGADHLVAYGYRDAPLSGEWAGESIPELSAEYSVDLSDTDIADLFEQGFFATAI